MMCLAACSDDASGDATISLTLDTESVDSDCPSSSCDDYGMSCGATIMIRFVDADTGEQLYRGDGQETPFFLCVEAESSGTLCSMSELAPQLRFFDLPPQNSRVEVAIFSSDDLSGNCDELPAGELFDLRGHFLRDVTPQPAFAGAAFFQARTTREVLVPLACPNPTLLESLSCEANLRVVTLATVRDIETVRDIRKDDAASITVALGEAKEESDGQGGSFFVLEVADTTNLPLNNNGETPVYTSELLLNVGSTLCAVTLQDVPQATPSISCERYLFRVDPLEIQPVLIGKEVVTAVVAALKLGDFPQDGIVIGRVVDESFRPIAGARVFPSTGTVMYLSEDMSTVSSDVSSTSGYFVSLDAEFGSDWTALDETGQSQSGTPIAGLVRGKTSSLIIRMTGDVIGQ